MVRAPCCEKMGLKKGPWTPEEDQILMDYIKQYGHGNWRALPKQAGLLRCGKSCRLRWINYLRPDIKRGNFTKDEEETIINLHELLGNRWSAIAARLPGRTDNEIKNVWHTHLKKRLIKQNNNNINSNSKSSPTRSMKIQSKPRAAEAAAVNQGRSDNITIEYQRHECSSSDIMSSSSVVTSVSDNNISRKRDMCVKMESSSSSDNNFGEIIDESFWSEVLSSADNFSAAVAIGEDDHESVQLELPSWAPVEPVVLHNCSSFNSTIYNHHHDNMEFWHNLLAGDLPDVPEI